MEQVIVVTVTYNSSQYLERLLSHIQAQTVRVSKIIVVDNASESAHRDKISALADRYDAVAVIRSEKNLGGAGGFELGMRRALEQFDTFDWIWLMDDDAFPKEDCLENLLSKSKLKNVGALAPVIFGNELKTYQLFHHKIESRFLNKDLQAAKSFDDLADVAEIEANAFVGPLIAREAIEAVGVPDGGLFIYGDDLEYIYRISRKFKVYLIKDAVIYHRDIVADPSTFQAQVLWKTYYMYRNRLLFIDEYATSCVQRWIGKLLVLFALSVRMAETCVRKKYKGNKRLRLQCLMQAWKDGNKGKRGKIIDPVEFNKLIK